MVPIPLLLALFLAFGVNSPLQPPESPRAAVVRILASIGVVALAAFALGLSIAWRVRSRGYATARVRRSFAIGSRLLSVAGLGAYGWMIHAAGWPGLVLSSWGWRNSILVDDALILAPFLVLQLLTWWGLFYGERAIFGMPAAHPSRSVARYLYLRERQSIALVLPIILIFVVRNDVFDRLWPGWPHGALGESAEIAGLGLLVLVASPMFLRLAWPVRSLPDGPLRTRLEAISKRSGFRCADILVWDTDHLMVNACVTGILPRFRYVLLSDALIDVMTPTEIAAVFGHEIGHVAHRHLPFFLFFFVGCLTVLTMASGVFAGLEAWVANLTTVDAVDGPSLMEVVEGLFVSAVAGGLFWMVFGHLSRRFERQADVYGCKAVSCDSPNCPPHVDPGEIEGRPLHGVCPTGVRIFADALTAVARLNGIDPRARSWRHGSIASRVAFLQGLAAAPAGEVVFQRRVRWMRLGLSAGILAVIGFSVAANWMGVLR